MSKLLTVSTIVILFFLTSLTLTAQTTENPNAVGFKALFLDYFTPNSGPSATLDDISNGFEVSYHRQLSKILDVAVPLRFGVIDLPTERDNKSLVGLDALLKLKYYKENNIVTPYLFAGAGYVLEDGNQGHFQVPAGLGVNFLVWKRAFINAQAAYRYSPTTNRNNLELGLGFIVNIGKIEDEEKDSDGDGIPDAVDKCPQVKGEKTAQGCPDKDRDGFADDVDKCPEIAGPDEGCPEKEEEEAMVDTDGDGVADDIDECPTAAGTLATKGCPDGDGDGVPDKDDLCPTEAGVPALDGCPDSDGDGIADRNDNCPNEAGLEKFNGCPDTDNDGVVDADDKCPTSPGPASNFGCPVIAPEVREALALEVRNIQFQTGKAFLKVSSYEVLDRIVAILNQYPDYKVSIAGHTDSVGSDSSNQLLSEERAKSCFNYLVSKDFDLNRLSFIGYGESQPIATNRTREGRRLNRRVEFNLYLE